MFSVDAIIDRLKQLPSTTLRTVDGIADMQALMRNNELPQVTPAAHVVPAGLQGGQRLDVAGGYVQSLTETVGVVVTIRGNDAQGRAALPRLRQIVSDVMDQICGWSPIEGGDQFQFARGAVLSLDKEGLVYLLEFSLPTQMRSEE